MDSTPSNDPVRVVISGPGHHERAARATSVIATIVALDLEVVVTTDLRPRLADDIRALLEAGASRVRLEADGIEGELQSATRDAVGGSDSNAVVGPDRRTGGPVIVILRPGHHLDPIVEGEGDIADAVREAIASV